MKPYYQVAMFFALTQLLGIFSGIVLIQGSATSQDIRDISVVPAFLVSNQNSPMDALATAVLFMFYILFGAVAIVLVARFYKGMVFFKLLETAVIASASAIVFFTIAISLGLGFISAFFLGGAAGFLLAVLKFFWVDLKNTAAIISSAGVGALFGYSLATTFGVPLGFFATVAFIILLSIYDYVAVFKTRHMIEMARELSTRQLSFAVTAKSVPERKPKESRKVYVERAMSEGERLDLGTGDLSVPAMISVAAFTLGPNGLLYSLTIAAGSTIALFLLLRFVSKQRVFLPALPPICLGGMAALLLVKLAGL